MIAVLCKSYQDACYAFYLFMRFLEENEPWSIQHIFKHENCVETDDDLRYIFVDHRVEHVFDDMCVDFTTARDLFDNINELYFCDEVIVYDE